MRYIKFGERQKEVSEVVLGLMRISEMTVDQVEDLIESALAVGINAFDIADCYGHGKCEQILGEVLKRRPDLREKMWIQSKCGIRMEEFTYFDFSKEHILEAVDGILERLNVDYIDSLLLHRPDALMEPAEIAEAFDLLKSQGKVIDFGVSNQNPMMMTLIQKDVNQPLVANQLQLSAAFTPSFDAGFHVNMKQEAGIVRDSSIFEYCRLHDVVIQAWSVLQFDYFGGVFLGSEKYPELNHVLNRLAEKYHVSPSAVAIAWVLRYPAKMQAVIGTTKKARVAEAAKAAEIQLTRKEWYEIYLAAGNDLP
ncbi:Oxidoreductase, aldo-keto reductase family [Streptococcus infantarius subsp. infantarius]|uniref:aldo/keto reductase n=1 Tax=Streptococcus infantarius TaxID=102684 RepID=UPI00024DCD03|nr:aldo/keto reductase [Streptococcus infantarius]AEZ63120.1 Oxidoreductase, aldo-keto reductase family [Streptococcus infantarius subsp. infantarius CJ18]MBT0931153.1 aldo/keto reductase [Streptococcus infantarius subsp. infantarius]MCO4511663.1 Oxidoreductase, aldo-keto reductase family [Streptococcus infantarius subsp. infantarius]MCO4513297.1 Oxidoreductase, aldo-keto reductase family [Streptococcus infantarius subsp. infantarius]MCO4515695.1 Oxidoreductase, aldo-keto reductase family [Str